MNMNIFKNNKKSNNLKTITIDEDLYHLLRYKSLSEDKDYSEILREVLK